MDTDAQYRRSLTKKATPDIDTCKLQHGFEPVVWRHNVPSLGMLELQMARILVIALIRTAAHYYNHNKEISTGTES